MHDDYYDDDYHDDEVLTLAEFPEMKSCLWSSRKAGCRENAFRWEKTNKWHTSSSKGKRDQRAVVCHPLSLASKKHREHVTP